MSNTASSPSDNNPLIEGIYKISSKSGDFFGGIIANIINYSTKATTVSLEAIKQGNEQFMKNVQPVYEDSKSVIQKKINEIVPDKTPAYKQDIRVNTTDNKDNTDTASDTSTMNNLHKDTESSPVYDNLE